MFLTIVFLLFFSLIGVAYEHARVFTADNYVKVAGNMAATTMYGDYARELFEEYGFFGYGGYDGQDSQTMGQDFQRILASNLRSFPEGKEGFADIYTLENVDTEVVDCDYLCEKEEFYRQLKNVLLAGKIKDVTGDAIDRIMGSESLDVDGKLAMTRDYEDGKYDKPQEGGNNSQGEQQEDENERKDSIQEPDGSESKDVAGGNPLEFFCDLVEEGILSMVCSTNSLQEGEIVSRQASSYEKEEEGEEEKGAAEYLQGMMKEEVSGDDVSLLKKAGEKLMLVSYCQDTFSSYVQDKDRTTRYGMEYLVAGREEEKANLAGVVERLLVMRMALNFACVFSDMTMQEKSLATATALAGFTCMPPVITAVQYTILLILAFQEACVDVTALLEGASVPVIKSPSTFKMKYEEICMGSRSLFEKKAKSYTRDKLSPQAGVSYEQYLLVFMGLVQEETLRNRTLDLIQYDLREKYNQSFCIDDCITGMKCRITYGMEPVFSALPYIRQEDTLRGWNDRAQEVSYRYERN